MRPFLCSAFMTSNKLLSLQMFFDEARPPQRLQTLLLSPLLVLYADAACALVLVVTARKAMYKGKQRRNCPLWSGHHSHVKNTPLAFGRKEGRNTSNNSPERLRWSPDTSVGRPEQNSQSQWETARQGRQNRGYVTHPLTSKKQISTFFPSFPSAFRADTGYNVSFLPTGNYGEGSTTANQASNLC